MHTLRRAVSSIISLSILVPSVAVAQDVPPTPGTATEPYEQDFVITAYYSPLPDQCCYIKGSYEADKILNGEGTHAADGTPVYPGMIAAPKSYPFGTQIDLPGMGMGVVHDRGGAIQEWDDTHRLDIWLGHGEEGLARALAFGVQRVRGTVYPAGTTALEPSIDIELFQAPLASIARYEVVEKESKESKETKESKEPEDAEEAEEAEEIEEVVVAALELPQYGATSEPVSTLQQQLSVLGYFHHVVTGYFGDVTKASMTSFLSAFGLSEPAEVLTATSVAYLQAALKIESGGSPIAMIDATSTESDIKKAQRVLRHLGYYRGRTDGVYSSVFKDSVVAFQVDHYLVADASSPGAGRIGPLTQAAITRSINKSRTRTLAEKWVQAIHVALEQGLSVM